jgi:hypothetical protein
VSPTEAGVGAAYGRITFFDGAKAIGIAELQDGLAALALPALDADREHVLTALDAGGMVAFDTASALRKPVLRAWRFRPVRPAQRTVRRWT